jgi:hypothetical protein
MRKLLLIVLIVCGGLCSGASAQNTRQNSQGNCSPNVANSNNSAINCNVAPLIQPPFVPQSRQCSVDGTLVPFKKIMSTAFAPEYEGCRVQTLANFERIINAGDYGATGLDNYVTILSYVPGEKMTCCIIAVPKNLADVAFSLKAGDTMNLLGGTRVRPVTTTEYSNVVFIVNAMSSYK